MRMDPHERRSAALRRAASVLGGILILAAVVLGVVGVVVHTGGSDLGLLALVAALALVTAGAGLVVAAVRAGAGRRR
jgi:protein-S-isoprenylcysteine O-methyltransferase Ste14